VPTDGARRPEVDVHRLMAAVLMDSIRILLGTGSAESRLRELDWILRRDRRYVFAFETICDGLGIDAPALRRRLLTRIDASLAVARPRATRRRRRAPARPDETRAFPDCPE
jgi:hypothetical protein